MRSFGPTSFTYRVGHLDSVHLLSYSLSLSPWTIHHITGPSFDDASRPLFFYLLPQRDFLSLPLPLHSDSQPYLTRLSISFFRSIFRTSDDAARPLRRSYHDRGIGQIVCDVWNTCLQGTGQRGRQLVQKYAHITKCSHLISSSPHHPDHCFHE